MIRTRASFRRPRRPARSTIARTAAAMMLLACVAVAVPAGAGAAEAEGIHKIQHVVMIMQENRSFDSYFGTYPGVNGIPGGVCLPDPEYGRCQQPFYNPSEKNYGGPHGAEADAVDVDGGNMDGFVQEAEARTKCKKNAPYCSPCTSGSLEVNKRCNDVMGYHDARQIPNYWKYAEKFVLQDAMFPSVASWSLPSHLYMFSGWSAICPRGDPNPLDCVNSTEPESPAHSAYGPVIPGKTTYSWTDISYLLASHGVSWRYFLLEGEEPDCELDETVECVHSHQDRLTPGIWNPLPDFVDVKEDGQLGNIQSLNNFYTDVQDEAECGLPNVAWVVPNLRVSEHPRSLLSAGQAYVTTLINSVMRSPCWESTAIFVSWDDWGGFYDNAAPPAVDQNGYGVRVPGLVISPYAKAGYIDHQQLSHDAYLKFIEDDFLGGERLDPATDGRPDNRPDARESAAGLGNLVEEFDFEQPPRSPLLLSPHPSPGPPSKPPGTPQQPPSVETGAASMVTSESAALAGEVNPHLGIISRCEFEYGTGPDYGNSAPCATLPEYGEQAEPVSAQLEGLDEGTAYYYRLLAANNEGDVSYGNAGRFTTTGHQGLPQVGRCLHLEGSSGRFQNAACTVPSPGEDSGGYEWQPGVLARAFQGSAGGATVGAAGKWRLSCAQSSISGSVEGEDTLEAVIVFEGCGSRNGKDSCQSAGAPPGMIQTEPLVGEVGYIEAGEPPAVGVDLRPAAGDGAVVDRYECVGAESATIEERGSVIAATDADAMSTHLSLGFAVNQGRQEPEALEGEPTDVLSALIEPLHEASGEGLSTWKAKFKLSFQEALEIKATA